MTKKEAIKLATDCGWTAEDAKRAYQGLNFKQANQEQILLALLKFAGPELSQRQRAQAAHKGLHTKARQKIEAIETNFSQEIKEGREKLEEIQSAFLAVLFRTYAFAKVFGFKDPWIEALIEAYKAHINTPPKEAA